MDAIQAIVLALVQGLTEFLPISSSAHLVIPSLILEWPDQGLAFDVAVHVGSLTAVVFYYRHTLCALARDWFSSLAGGGVTANSRLVWYLGFATVPAGLAGIFLEQFIEQHARNLLVIASTTLIFGVLLGLADRHATRIPGDNPITFGRGMCIGLAQAMALVPGVSRSGVTITAALWLNMSRQDAARFSFLLSIPIIASAGALKTWELIGLGEPFDWQMMALGTVVSGLAAYACIALFLRLLDRVGMMPFVYYRIALALLLYGVWATS
ncbi:undecaprenyl-diphosphate phosphatase [Halioglobus maricola]|uniref:Undecaprenyl-diphosphatase n=1 Tax=Halioglobus maricola TaxID=2601894 RepID=A0A5P9NS14_9GAMM|nr:undecaprenyl-diphosphate phosphatase [Halioglobus maricola]QFU77888.1 undecaprenyl-diphosphate phosphatase [Halioglobus maricola]